MENLTAAGIPAGLLRNARELRPHPHLEEREFFVTREHPIVGELGYPCFPTRFSGHYLPIPGPAHTLGQYNDAVQNLQLYLKRYPDPVKSPRVHLDIVLIREKQRSPNPILRSVRNHLKRVQPELMRKCIATLLGADDAQARHERSQRFLKSCSDKQVAKELSLILEHS